MTDADGDDQADVFGLIVECPKCGFTAWSRGAPETTRFHLRERGWRRLLVGLMLALLAVAVVVACEVREHNRWQQQIERFK